MRVKFHDIEHAVEFVSFNFGENEVFLSRDTGKLFYIHEIDASMSDELPADFEEGGYLSIPGKNQLGLKQNLVHEFANGCSDEIQQKIRDCFRKRGAYRRFRALLDRNGLLDAWYKFENQAERDAICAWCADNKIELDFKIE